MSAASGDASSNASASVREVAREAKAASRILAKLDERARNAALEAMAQGIEQAAHALFAANSEDLQTVELLTGDEALSPATISRLKLNQTKLAEMAEQIQSVAALPDPLGRVLETTELDDVNPFDSKNIDIKQSGSRDAGLHLQKIAVPLGVLAVIFEARPDAVTQIAALALKSGNAVILKPGREVERTAIALVDVLRDSLKKQRLPEGAISLVLGRERVNELLGLHDAIDLVIPRGGKSLVEFVQANTRIPVLGHAEGICHIYVDRAADPALALRVIEDAKLDYPAACNAVETVLVHRDIAQSFLPALAKNLHEHGVVVHADSASRKLLGDAKDLHEIDAWNREYGAPELALGVVDSIDAAIAHIHAHGSAHTESILTEDDEAAEKFLREVDAAGVFHNASTRFADGFRYGFGAEVGISTSKLHARGPVGLEGLTTYKYVLRGHGHVAGDYRAHGSEPAARKFTHRREARL